MKYDTDQVLAAWERRQAEMFNGWVDAVHFAIFGEPFPWGESEWEETLEGTDVY